MVNIDSGGCHGGIVNSPMFCLIPDITMTMGKNTRTLHMLRGAGNVEIGFVTDASTQAAAHVLHMQPVSDLAFCSNARRASYSTGNLLAKRLLVLKALTAIATAAASSTSCWDAPASLAPARLISVQGLHPAPKAAASVTSCFVFGSRAP